MGLLHSLSCRAYRVLLRAYPPAFRREYGEEMALVFSDSCREAIRRAGLGGLIGFWLRVLGDIAATASHERWIAADRRAAAILLTAAAIGLAIGFADHRASEVQGTVLLLLVCGFLFGVSAPRGAWRWALAVGIGVPLISVITWMLGIHPEPNYKSVFGAFIALIPAFLGVYAGVATRWLGRMAPG